MEYKILNVSDLRVDESYQRPLTVTYAQIAKNYDEKLFQPLTVSQRADGSYYVIDGRHRLEAAKILSLMTVPCMVHTGLNILQEADLFSRQATGTAKMRPVDSYKANVFVGNPENIDVIIDSKLKEHKFAIAKHEHAQGFWCIATLRRITKKRGIDSIDYILRLIKSLKWEDLHKAKSTTFMYGYLYFIDNNVDLGTATHLLETTTPDMLYADSVSFGTANIDRMVYDYIAYKHRTLLGDA